MSCAAVGHGHFELLRTPEVVEVSPTRQRAISVLATGTRSFRAPLSLARNACVPNDEIEPAESEADREEFWKERGKRVEWMQPLHQVFSFEPPRHRWVVRRTLNVTVSCIDRHVHSDRRSKAAVLWIGEDGEEHAYSYARLYREVNRFANALMRLGGRKGDRVIVYGPRSCDRGARRSSSFYEIVNARRTVRRPHDK